MTKKEENLQSLNVKFKIKLTKLDQDVPGIDGESFKIKLGEGLYSQLKGGNTVNYNHQNFSMQSIQQALTDVFIKDPTRTRSITMITNEAGLEEFDKALKKEALKTLKKNGNRKKLSFRSKIFKQTYKFR